LVSTTVPPVARGALAFGTGTGDTVRVNSRALMIVGLVAVLVGGVWALQGSGVLGGSGMSNSPTWLVIGVVVVVAGALMIVMGARGRRGRG